MQAYEWREVTSSFFNALEAASSAGPVQPELLYQQLSNYLERLPRVGQAFGLSRDDVEDVRYALAAFADEVAVGLGGHTRDFWMSRPLQLKLFNENTAGDAFFTRLDAIRRGHGHPEVLGVYYLCLALGFRGKYTVRGGEVELIDLAESLRESLDAAGWLSRDAALSPHGDRPDEPSAERGRDVVVISIAAAAATVAFLVYFVLRFTLAARAGELVELITSKIGS